MYAIRLFVSSEDPGWKEIGPRLRDAAIEWGHDETRNEEPSGSCHAVVLAGPRRIESETIERFLRAGKHVLLAAEPCLEWPRLEALTAAARQAGVQFAVTNPDRYLPSRQLIKQQLGANLGEAGLIRIHRWEPATEAAPSPLGLPGPLVRDLDMALWLSGKTPNRVYALGADSGGRCVLIQLGFPGSGMALIDYDGRLPSGEGYQSLSVIGSTGAAYADEQQNMQLIYRGGRPQAVGTAEGPVRLAALVQDFVDAIAAGRDLGANVATWRDVHTVADAVQQSLASRQAVALEGR